MKRAMVLIFILVGFMSAFEISSLDAAITVEEDGSIVVRETYNVAFGLEQWHGLERIIPIKYNRDGHNYKLRLDILSAEDENGRDYRLSKSKSGRNIVIRMGDPEKLVSGDMVYVLTYRVVRALNFFDPRAELYWNVTGNDWRVAIDSARTSITLPRYFAPSEVLIDSWTGSYGSQGGGTAEFIDDEGVIHFNSGRISPGNGLTFAVSFPGSAVRKPSFIKEAGWFLMDNVMILLGLLLPIVVFVLLFRKWLKKGRDPIDIDSGIVRYQPPDELLPAEVGSLWDETVDMRDITSSIIDLAVRGYIRIEELETDHLLFLKKNDYRLVQLRDFDDLTNYEVTLMVGLFSYGTVHDKETGFKQVLVSELKEKFYRKISNIKTGIMNSLMKKGCFDEKPGEVSGRYFILGGLIIGIGIFIGVFTQSIGFVFCAVVSGIIAIAFAKAMPRKTRHGAILARQILGFREFVSRVEKDRIEKMAKDDPTIFDRLLPYAMALGVEDHWAGAFKDIYREPPDWYTGHGMGSSFRTGMFVHSLGSAMNTMGRSMSSVPRGSSAGSGGSGFSSGGGFSGGGFGGGGGGGW